MKKLIRRLNEERADASSDERGFTLIEVMIVVLIIGILIGIAVPTFLGAVHTASDRAAESTLSTAYTDARAAFAQDDTYTDFFDPNCNSGGACGDQTTVAATDMAAQEPSIKWVGGHTTDSGDVAIYFTATGATEQSVGAIGLAYWQSRDDKCFAIWDDPSAKTIDYYSTSVATAANCSAPTSASAASSWVNAGDTWGGPNNN